MGLVAPPAAEVVELDLAGGEVGHHGVNPIGQLYGQPFDFAAEELGLALHRRGQVQALAGGPDGGSVLDLRLYLNDVRHSDSRRIRFVII